MRKAKAVDLLMQRNTKRSNRTTFINIAGPQLKDLHVLQGIARLILDFTAQIVLLRWGNMANQKTE